MIPAPEKNEHWHLDKKVPISLIIVILAQFAMFLMFAGRTMQRADEQERRITSIEAQNTPGRLGIVESRVTDFRETLAQINSKLDRLIEARRPAP